MLPKAYRLNQKADFQKVLKKGKMFHSPLLGLSVLKTNTAEKKIGIIVSNKVSKKAVIRNKIKRLLREAAREKLEEIKIGTYAVFLTKPKASVSLPEIKKQALQLLGKC